MLRGLVWPKDMVPADYPQNPEELVARIERGFRIINRNQDVINRAIMSIKDRAELCIEVEGGYFEQYQQGKDQNNNEVIWTSGESGDESAWKSSKNLNF